jgi:NADPH-dependent glutamate synthase beta subunit-like oxidoreductase/coenzyme F420-reducing hydrogenase delta subunit/ferredoxin
VSIAALKRFIADYELRHGALPRLVVSGKKQGRVAVIGAGPAGLTCAADLAREGYTVTVFEALPVPGGMMAVGIPPYRLPRDILRLEIEAIEALGVDLLVNTPVGDNPTFDDLIRQFDAVFVATGAQKTRRLGIPGESHIQQGLVDWSTFLREVALEKGEKPGEDVAVIGGGNTAVDCARVALRLGSRNVRILYRRSRSEMPAFTGDVAHAEAEGVRLDFLVGPVDLRHEEGRLVGVECVRMGLGRRDNTGRRQPRPIKSSAFLVPCDAMISAIGQEFDPSFLGVNRSLNMSADHLLAVDPDTLATSQKGVFAGGDAITGPATVVEAIAAGHRASLAIDRYLQGLPLSSSPDSPRPDPRELTLDLPSPPVRPREKGAQLPATEGRRTFDEVDQGLTEAQAVAEAERCIRCGPCQECKVCVGVCEMKQLIIDSRTPRSRHAGWVPDTLVRVPPDTHERAASQASIALEYRGRPRDAFVFTAKADEVRCRGCGLCEEVCGYRAVQVVYQGNGVFTARVDESMCRGCGTCVSVCPTGAMTQAYFTSRRIDRHLKRFVDRGRRRVPVVVFACRWSDAVPYALEGLPIETAGVMCIGRVTGGDVLGAFEHGASGVLIIGCERDTCHYGFGCQAAIENVQRLSDILSLVGLNPDRLRILHTSLERGLALRDAVKDFLAAVEKIGAPPLDMTHGRPRRTRQEASH